MKKIISIMPVAIMLTALLPSGVFVNESITVIRWCNRKNSK